MARTPGPRIVVPQASPTTAALEEVARLARRGVLVPVIDRVFGLDHAAQAVSYVETEHARGKVVVAVGGYPGREPRA
jgi:NADPH:quinone reductase-like Zn-dependent oxidoreductase